MEVKEDEQNKIKQTVIIIVYLKQMHKEIDKRLLDKENREKKKRNSMITLIVFFLIPFYFSLYFKISNREED